MKKEQYVNFDGSNRETGTAMDGTPSNIWFNMQGTQWQQTGQGLNTGTEWQDASMNASGQTLTLDHHDSRLGPNMELVLPDNDNSVMPDSDIYSNHPGFLGGTWWKDFWFPGKAEKERAAAARESIDSKFPISGSCTLLNSTVEGINKDLAYHGRASKRGAKRVAKRNIPLLKKKLKTVEANRDIQCQAEEDERLARQQEQMVFTQQFAQQMSPPQSSMNPVNLILGVIIIGGLVWGISRLAKPKSAPAK